MIQKYKEKLPKVYESCYIAPGSFVIGDVTIGDKSSVWHNAVLRGDVNKLIIGENSNIQDLCVIHCADEKGTVVGNNVTVGHGAILHACDIKDNCLIGMGAVVLDGVIVGKNSIVGANALVPPNMIIPENSLVLGNPGKVVRSTKQNEVDDIIKNACHYRELSLQYLEEKG